MNDKLTPSAGTIARTIILALALINQILVNTGRPVIEIDNDTIETLVNSSITIIAAIASWWKNNSFTENAIIADTHLHALNNLGKAGE